MMRSTIAEWTEFLAQPPQNGGMAAQVVDFEALIQDRECSNFLPLQATREQVSLAKQDLQGIRQSIRRFAKRKSTPDWSAPVELWTLLLWPQRNMRLFQAGLGSENSPVQAPLFFRRLQDILLRIRMTGKGPLEWFRSLAFNLDKPNGKPGPAGNRTIHTFCPIGKAWLEQLFSAKPYLALPSTHHGYEKGRSREGAVLVQLCMSYEMRHQSLPGTS